jgi:hypothetical protein
MIHIIETRMETTKHLPRTIGMSTLRCITGNTLRDRIRDEDICNICEIQDIVRWAKIRRQAWRNHVNKMDDNWLAKS